MGSAPRPLSTAACAALLAAAVTGCASGSGAGQAGAGSGTPPASSRPPAVSSAATPPPSRATSPASASSVRSSAVAPAATRVVTIAAAAVPVRGPATRGSCFTSSLADPGRAGAFRCVAGNTLLDPCLAVSAHALVCGAGPEGPWRRLTVAGLPSSAPAPPALAHAPWAVRLASGLTCTSIGGGTADLVDGQPVLYRCGHGGELVGGIDTAGPLWRARLLAPGNTRPVPAPVVTAWR